VFFFFALFCATPAVSVVLFSAALALADTTIFLGSIDNFDGPNDLDLDPTKIVYAIEVGGDGTDRPVRGVTFLSDSNVIAGYSHNAGGRLDWSGYSFTDGLPADNTQLNEIMNNARCCGTHTYNLDVTTGTSYRLQLLWGEADLRKRVWDVRIDGQDALDEIDINGLIVGGVEQNTGAATRYLYDFTAPDNQLNITLGNQFGANDGGDRNYVMSAIILSNLLTVDHTLTWDGDTGDWGDVVTHAPNSHWIESGAGTITPEIPEIIGDSGDEAIVPGGVATVAADRGAYSLEVKTGGAVNVGNNTGGTKTLTLLAGADVLAASALNVRSDGVLDVPGAVTVTDGTLDVAGTVQAASLDVTGGSGSVSVGGTLDVTAGTVTVGAGAGLTVTGGGTINADVVDSAGTTNFQSGSLGTVPTVNVTGGVTTLSSPSITTVNATGGVLNTAASVTNLNVAGATVNTTGALTASAVDVSSGSLTLGADMNVSASMGATGGTINTAGNAVSIGNNGSFTSAGATFTAGPTGTFKVAGANLVDDAAQRTITISGGAVSVAGGVPASGLIAYWPFKQGAGATAFDQSGSAPDGNITGAAWVSDPTRGWVLDFEGADYVDIPAPTAAFNSIVTTQKVSISVWQYGDEAIQPQADWIFEGRNGGRQLSVHLPWNNNNVYWDAFGNVDRINKAASPAEYEGQWNHWVFTKDRSTGTMKIFLNGSLWHSGTGLTRSYVDITTFKIGSEWNGNNSYDGMLDDFAVYDRVLTDDEILALAAGGAGELSFSNTDIVVSADGCVLDLAGSTGATFGELSAGSGPFDFYITGNSWTAVDGLANTWAALSWVTRNANGDHVGDTRQDAWLTIVPEPGTLLLALIGLLGIAAPIRRRKR